MAFDIDVYVSYAHADNVPLPSDGQGWVSAFMRALKARMSQLLGHDVAVYLDERPLDSNTLDDDRRRRLERAATVVAIVSSHYVESERAQREVEFFAQAHAGAGEPTGATRLFPVLRHALPLAERPRPLLRLVGYEFFSVDQAGTTREFHPTKDDRDFWRRLDALAHDLAAVLQPLHAFSPELEAIIGKPAPRRRATRERDRVLLGVSAPYGVTAGGVFTARFAAYTESHAHEVEERLRELDAHVDGGTHSVLGLSPDRTSGWRAGAPVTVRVTGTHLRSQPSTRSFDWNGRQNIVSFLVEVNADAPPGEVALCFEAFIEGVSVAFIPLTVTIGTVADEPEREMIVADLARTAFASYASADAPLVAACLSALQRWDPDLEIFMDCLDLRPNGAWQQELQEVIPRKDAFLLFWSVNASRSPWVAWELEHAQASKGLDWIRPMPLEDPVIAPPPDELKHLHFGDRYLIARQAFLRRSDHGRRAIGPTK